MKTSYRVPVLALALLATACESTTVPDLNLTETSTPAMAPAAAKTAATGSFTQTGITSLVVSQAGPNTVIEQTSTGLMSGTLSGTYTDDIRVVIHPNGRFNAQFTIRCECTMAGKQGTVEFVASDQGELLSPTLAVFAGRATITGGSNDLSALRGVLEIEGSIDLATGLSTYNYSGLLH